MNTIPVRRFTNQQPAHDKIGRFSIRKIEEVLKGDDLIHDLHKHDFFFVLAVQAGHGVHEIDFAAYPVQERSIFILRPGQVHKLQLSGNSTGFLMEFDLAFYQPRNTITEHRWKKASNKNFCEVEAARFVKLHNILINLFNEFNTKQEGYIEAIRANLDLFFIEYIRQSLNPKSIAKAESRYMQDRFEEFIGLLENNITTMKNVSQYADLLSMSSYQLNAITKASVGKTVSDLITEQIILEAKRNLLATSNQIKEIADQLGFEDPSYFIRFFRKHTSFSPDAFRKKFQISAA